MAHFNFVIIQNAKWGPPIKNQNMRTGKYSFTKKSTAGRPSCHPTNSIKALKSQTK